MPIPYDNLRNELVLRGGSLRKSGKTILTRAPALASTSMLALGALLCLNTASLAGECVSRSDSPSRYVCSGVLDSESDITQRAEARSGERLVVTQDGPFGVSVGDGNALEFYGAPGSTGINANLGAILRTFGGNGEAGISLEHNGTGDVYLSNSGGYIDTQGDGIKAFAGTESRNMDIRINDTIGTPGSRTPVNGEGIDAFHRGSGNLNIAARDIFSETFGISARTDTTTAATNIHSVGFIETEFDGIKMQHRGLRALNIELSSIGGISTNQGYGIYALSQSTQDDATGHTTIIVDGAVTTGLSTGRRDAVHARHLNRGNLTVRHASLVIGSSDGFDLQTGSVANNMVFASGGSVRAQDYAVKARHTGIGILSINARDLAAQTFDAINAYTSSSTTGASITATGNFTAGRDGIRVDHNGTGALTVTLAGTAAITSATRYGIYAKTANIQEGATSGMNISVGGDIGTEDTPTGSHAVSLKHEGRGDANITLLQDVNLFTQGRGVDIETAGYTGNVNLRTDANIRSVNESIRIRHRGTGDVSVHATGDIRVTSTENPIFYDGIRLFSSRDSRDVYLNFSGNVYATEDAINISSEGRGDVSVRVAEGSVLHAQYNRALRIWTSNFGTTQDVDVHVAGRIGTRTNRTGSDGIVIYANGTGDVSATLTESGGIFSRKTAIDIATRRTARNVTVQAYGDIMSREYGGIFVEHSGTGPVNITSGNIEASTYGIHVAAGNFSSNEINIRANGNITSREYAIRARQGVSADLNITTAPGTTLTSREREVIAARAYQNNTDSMNITIGGDVIATGATPADAVRAYTAGAGDINITVAYGANVQGGQGIVATRDQIFGPDRTPRPENTPRGTVHVDVGGRVQGETTAINMDAGITHRLTLRPGSQIIGNITSTGAANAFLVLDDSVNDGGSGTLGFDGISGFNRLNKNGIQNWRLVGGMDEDQAFTLVIHNEGNMFIDDFAFLTAPEHPGDISVLIEPDASLFVQGSNGRIEGNIRNNGELTLSQTGFIRGSLSNAGTLKVNGDNRITGDLTGAGIVNFQRGNNDAALTVNGDFETGGTVVFNFSPTRGYTNTLDIRGELIGTEPTRVEVYTNGDVPPSLGSSVPVITTPTPQQSGGAPLGDEVDETDSGLITEHADSFVVDRVIGGAFTFDFEHDAALEGWVLRQSGFSPRVPAFKNYPASLARLARLPSMQERLGGRAWLAGEGRGIWAKAEGAHTYLKPSGATVKSSYEIHDRRVRFGLDVPLGQDAQHAPGRGWRLGANASFGSADTDVAAVENGEHDGSIDTDLFTLALDARWIRPEGLYVDTQAQYAVFSSDIASQQESMTFNNDADAFRLSGEVGYRFEAGGFSLAPQVQVEWGKVDFDGFIAPHNENVSLEDGNVTDGRIGLAFDRQWTGGPENRASLSAGAHLRIPFDGKTVVDVSSMPLVSERKDIALELNAGFDYQWDNNTFTAGLATAQGGEVEDYRASLSLRFGF